MAACCYTAVFIRVSKCAQTTEILHSTWTKSGKIWPRIHAQIACIECILLRFLYCINYTVYNRLINSCIVTHYKYACIPVYSSIFNTQVRLFYHFYVCVCVLYAYVCVCVFLNFFSHKTVSVSDNFTMQITGNACVGALGTPWTVERKEQNAANAVFNEEIEARVFGVRPSPRDFPGGFI